MQPPTATQESLDITYAVLRADRERLVAELEFLRQQVTAAEQAQAEMRRLLLAVTAAKPREGQDRQVDQAALAPEGQAPAPRPGLWRRIRG